MASARRLSAAMASMSQVDKLKSALSEEKLELHDVSAAGHDVIPEAIPEDDSCSAAGLRSWPLAVPAEN